VGKWNAKSKKKNKMCAAIAKSTARLSCLVGVGVLYDIYRETINKPTNNQPLLRNWPRKLLNSTK